MNLEVIADGASRFAVYVEELTKMIGPADRARPLRRCCAGLLASEGRRSVEPMAAVLRFQLRPAPQPILDGLALCPRAVRTASMRRRRTIRRNAADRMARERT